jgi:hypothetical protein
VTLAIEGQEKALFSVSAYKTKQKTTKQRARKKIPRL